MPKCTLLHLIMRWALYTSSPISIVAKVELQFAGSAYSMPSLQLDAQSCINWYVTSDPTGKYKTALLPRQGLRLYTNDNNEHFCRGALELNGILYVVIDNNFYIYYPDRSRELIGHLNTSVGIVKLITNYVQVFITDGQYGYIYQILKTDFRDAGEFFVLTNSSTIITTPVFTGTGANDLGVSGTYTGDTAQSYRVEIDGAGTPNTFKWSKDGGLTWVGVGIAITTSLQLLEYGIYIAFSYTTGHIVSDFWTFDISFSSSFYAPVIPAYLDGWGIYAKPNSNR